MGDIYHLTMIWLAVLTSVYLSKHTRLTSVLYFLFIGCLLVNLGLVPLEASPFIKGFSDIGIIIIMFALGFEEDSERFVSNIRRSWGIAFFGAAGPFFAAYGCAYYFWNDNSIALMAGMTLTATAVSFTLVVLKEEGLQATNASMGIMTSVMLDDIASLAFMAVLVPMATGGASLGLMDISFIVAKALIFFVCVILLAVWVFPRLIDGHWIRKIPFVGDINLESVLSLDRGRYAVLIVLILAMLFGLMSEFFGLHPAIGAYMAGLILKRDYFYGGQKRSHLSFGLTKNIVNNVAFSWIGPVFFVHLGSKLVFEWEVFVTVIPMTILLTLALMVVQITTAGLSARYTGGYTKEESVLIGIGMLGRAELAFVVIDIAYVHHQIFTIEVFYTLMFTIFWLNLSVPFLVRWWKPRCLDQPAVG